MKTVTFYVSSGRKHAQYTLWEKYENPTKGNQSWKKDEWYVCNLGNDKVRALKKAKELVGAFRKESFAHEYTIIDNTQTNFTLNAYGSQPVDGWDAKNLLIVENDGVFPYGKHVGMKFEDVNDNYLLWWADKEITNGTRKAVEAIINACCRIATHKNLFEKRIAEEKVKTESREKALANQNYVGTVDERRNFKITLDFVKSYESMYGVSWIYKGSDEDENTIVYFGTAELGNVGDTVEFSAKIKKHDTYNDDKQTIVSRPTKIKIVNKGEATLKNEAQQEVLNNA